MSEPPSPGGAASQPRVLRGRGRPAVRGHLTERAGRPGQLVEVIA